MKLVRENLQKNEKEINQFILTIMNKKYLSHPLKLMVSFTLENNYWFIEAKKLKFSFKSTNIDIEQSKLEFSQLVVEYIEYLFNTNTLKETLIALKFKLMPESIIEAKFYKESRINHSTLIKEDLSLNNNKNKKVNWFKSIDIDWKSDNLILESIL